MTNKLFISIFFYFISIAIIAQTNDYVKFRELNVGIGYMEYMNTAAIPSGLPGTIYRLEYHSGKVSKLNSNRIFEFVARTDYAFMIRKGIITDLNIPYYHGEIKLGAICKQIVPIAIPNFTIYAGLGFSMNVLTGYNPTYTYENLHNKLYPYGNWFVSPDLHFDISYQANKYTFNGGFCTPLLVTGFFYEYQNSSYDINNFGSFVKYIIPPNTFDFFPDYFRFDGFLSATYLLTSTDKSQLHFKLNYSYESLNSTIHFNSEKKQKQLLSIGLVILRK